MHTIGCGNKRDSRSASVCSSYSKPQQSFDHLQLAEFRNIGGATCCKYASDYSVGSSKFVNDE